MIFSKWLKIQRKRKHWSQYDLAREGDIPRNNISSWELDRSIPKTDMMMKLARVLNVPESEVFEAAGYLSEINKRESPCAKSTGRL